jgi:iron complex outermembrane receptor protein
VFDIEWNNIQITVSGTSGADAGQGWTANGGRATSRGFELSSSLAVLEGLRLTANVSYANAHLDENVPALNGEDGDRLPLSPQWNGSVAAHYDVNFAGPWSGGGFASVGYKGNVWSDLPHASDAVLLKSQTIVDGNLHVAKGPVVVKLFAKNLFDERRFNDVYLYGPSQVDFVPIQPRTIGIGVDTTF